jgi:hypothetical protein
MKNCPKCAEPISSIMMLDAQSTPQYYCVRCTTSYPIKAARKPELVAA